MGWLFIRVSTNDLNCGSAVSYKRAGLGDEPTCAAAACVSVDIKGAPFVCEYSETYPSSVYGDLSQWITVAASSSLLLLNP